MFASAFACANAAIDARRGRRVPPDSEKRDLKEVALSIISGRRSIRKFSAEPVSDEAIRLVLEAARWAPSGENSQCWRFIVIRDPITKQKLGELARGGSGRRFSAEWVAEKTHTRFDDLQDPEKRKRIFTTLTSGAVSAFLGEAPVLIAVCGRMDVWDLPFDTAAAIENLLIMASAIGLGACWVIAPVEDVRDEEIAAGLLDVPHGFKLITTVALGYPARTPGPRPRKPLEDIVFYERFDSRSAAEYRVPDFHVTPVESRNLPVDYLNDLIFDLERNFWIERGGGTRFRTCMIGWEYFGAHEERLASAESVEGCTNAVRQLLVDDNVVRDFLCVEDEASMLEGSETFSQVHTIELRVEGCAHLSVEKRLLEKKVAPYVCPCANAFSYSVRKALGLWTELSSISIDGDLCRVKLVALKPTLEVWR